jgi:uncharacterized protein YpuA (DUF1002 family)
MRLKEFVKEQAPPAPSPPMGPMDMGTGIGQPPAAATSKAEIKHKELHNKEISRMEVPAVAALAQIQQRIIKNKLDPKMDINNVLDQLGNVLRTDNFTADALRDLIDNNPAVKNVIKNVEPDSVIFKTRDSDNLGTNATNKFQDPRQTVSAMANKALKRRQK